MKQLLLALSVVVVSSAASAGTCFKFVNGKGPSRVANYQFAAQATKVCFSQSRDGVAVNFSDSEGELAVFSADELSTGRCGGYCKTLGLNYGNVNGYNADATGVTLTIQSQVDSMLGVSKGSFSLQTSRSLPELYNVIQAQ